ncbi:MAG TPA: M20/M25/M40 family metallo-hydrolase [Alphaproteobacteria bacterium]|nr:M20/M25/M40 family metallo-hydrolase [Alphaproteobacteria bacterium]
MDRVGGMRAERAAYWAEALTAIPSVTGTADEAAFAEAFAALLRQSPAFAGRPDDVWTLPVPDGRHPRACVCALVRGRGPRTVVLTGHFDTVTVEDYADLKPLATQPGPLRDALLARLRRSAVSAAEKRALADLEGGDFMPGRGLLDMKGGLAAGLAVLEDFAARPERVGNLLFVGVPDEEVNSAGARAAARALPALAARLGLSLEAAINLDAIADDGDGSEGRAVALGTVGKLLPSALVVGRPAHASYTFRGLGAAALAGAVAAAMEWAPELTERTDDEVGAGPTLLGMKDGKTAYDVTMPDRVWMYWNVALHRNGPAAVLDTATALIRRAVDDLVATLRRRHAQSLGGDGAAVPDVEVTTFAALRREAESRDPAAAAAIAAYAREVAERGLDLPEQCRLVTERVWALSGRTMPAVVLGFASMPYLPTQLGDDPAAQRLAAATRAAVEAVAARHGTGIKTIRYFAGISDMSFLGQGDEAAVPVIGTNTPAWGAGLPWPEGRALGGVPIVNAGPWGRDYHTPLERLHTPYGYTILPDLVAAIADGVLEG